MANDAFLEHVRSGLTTLCRAWAITRADGVTYGFTDHDCPIYFDGIDFRANSGLTAAALAQSTGLSVDNSEALGALSDAAVTDADIESGRFDGAEVRAWRVNWSSPDTRWLMFRGTIGEIKRAGGAFHAELRGLTEVLNRPLGRVFQKPCTAVLGDKACGFDASAPGYRAEQPAEETGGGRVFSWADLKGFQPGWFRRGRLDVLGGAGAGLWGMIKEDRFAASGTRIIELWEPIRAQIAPGDAIRLTAGCDKRTETCRLKFNNLLNYQGFPDLPGEDWQMAYPRQAGTNSGGSLR